MVPRQALRVSLVIIGLVLATCALLPPARCQAINGVIWIGARTFPQQLPRLQQALSPAFPAGAVLLVGDSLIGQLPPRWVNARAINLGIGAIGVAGVRANLRAMTSLATASAVVIIVGTNDVAGAEAPPAWLGSELAALLTGLPKDVPALVCSVPPVDPRVHRDRDPEAIRRLNSIWQTHALSRPRTSWIDLTPMLSDPQGNLARELHQGDGLHLSPAGNRLLAQAIQQALPPRSAAK